MPRWGWAGPGAPVGPARPGPPATVTGEPVPIWSVGSTVLPEVDPPSRAALPEGEDGGVPRVEDVLDDDGGRLWAPTCLTGARCGADDGAEATAPPDGSPATPASIGTTRAPPRQSAPPRVSTTTATEAAAASTGASGVYLRTATRRRTGAARSAATWADRV